jgi:hypothetical protein
VVVHPPATAQSKQKPVPASPRRESLPTPRPFNLDQLAKELDRVEQDLEQQMEEMEAEIRKRQR